MLTEIKGKILRWDKDKVDLEVGPVTLTVFSPVSYIQKLKKGKKAHFFTEFILDETGLSLYGFETEKERDLFRRLTRIRGVGKKMAFRLLNGNSLSLLQSIADGEEKSLQSISGIGVKTARRIIAEMKDEVLEGKWGSWQKGFSYVWADALQALLSLGFTRREAQQKLHQVRSRSPSMKSLEALIREALKQR